jgi:hypothetical protein
MPIILTHVSPPPVRWWRTGGQPCGVCAIISAWLSEFTVTDHRRVCSLKMPAHERGGYQVCTAKPQAAGRLGEVAAAIR